jgi:hypothetical protein
MYDRQVVKETIGVQINVVIETEETRTLAATNNYEPSHGSECHQNLFPWDIFNIPTISPPAFRSPLLFSANRILCLFPISSIQIVFFVYLETAGTK